MNENKNVVIALVLMLVVWIGFTVLFPAQQPTEPTPTGNESAEKIRPAVGEENIPRDVVIAEQQERPDSALSSQNVADFERDIPIREIVIETDLYKAVLSSSGARLTSFELKQYRSTADPESPLVELINAESLRYATLQTEGTGSFSLPEDAPYEVDTQNNFVKLGKNDVQPLQFRSVTPTGLEIIKTFVFKDGHYSIDLRTTVRNLAQGPLTGELDLALVKFWDDDADRDAYSFAGPATLVDGKLDEVKVKKLKDESPTYGREATWTSIQSKYFLDVIVPLGDSFEQIRVERDNNKIENTLKSESFTLNGGESRQLDYFLFFGPKDIEVLKAEGHQLEKNIDFGFFEILSKPLLYVLTFFYGYLQNYGLAIILLTIIIKILFWPLTHKSYASMKSMQKLQPEMQKIRERFKSDKERLNKELMQLYKNNRVNPMGGCLPMLVQIPVFFALYKVLLGSLALRHAPFALWLTDLSAKDPYYITPILMGASMFVQQKLTPMSGDPMQAKIMTFLPIVFTFMFLNFPSGLVIYWLVNNLLTIVQQYYIHRKA